MRRIGDFTLRQLAKQYEYDIFKDFFPFLDKHVVDHKLGGFMTNVDRDGTLLKTTKNTWYCGRGIWAYSFFYNNFKKKQRYLDIAEKSVLFIANALAEFSKAAGDSSYWDKAKDIVLKCVRIFDRPDYAPNAAQVYLGKDAPSLPGARIMGVSMLLLNVTQQMLAHRDDPELAAVNERAVRSIMDKHYNPEYGLLNEVLNHDYSRPDNIYRHLVYTGHAIETMWMMLCEAHRRRDRELFRRAEAIFKRHIEIAWDAVFGGFFRGLKDVYANLWILDKPLWTQEEALIGTLFVIEHTGAAWAEEWFARTFAFVQDKFSLRKRGLSLYDDWPDRLVTFVPHHTRVEIFHHPRHLMLNLLGLRRLLERRGKPSGFLES
jgi:N-acylglucosamine 2-epimerase